MALRELQAMQVAYEALSPLDSNAQQRVLTWLSAALADTNGASTVADESATPVEPATEQPAENPAADNIAQVAAEPAVAVSEAQTTTTAPTIDPVAADAPRATAEAQPAPEPGPRAKPARAANVSGRRPAKTAKTAATKPVQQTLGPRGERPTGEEFLADLAAAGSYKALAGAYGKSIGTIGNWANQLREQGFDIPAGRQKKA
jgi:hypothetical protein